MDFEHLEKYQENNRIEAKKATGGLPESIWETYSAFANTEGGIILLGVIENEDKSLQAIDLIDPESLVMDFWKMVNDPAITSSNILTSDCVTLENINGKQIVAIRVPKASEKDRPVFVCNDPVQGAYIRIGESDVRLKDAEAGRFELLMAKVKALQTGEATGHDWFHTQRVLAMSREIAKQEDCNMEIVQTAALLHDVADHKFGYTPESRVALLRQLMTEATFPAELQKAVIEVVESISFSEGIPCRESLRKERDVVKDADRLDALGAIGIARAFAYGGKMGRPIYDPEDPSNSLQHFDDKLLHLAEGMRTETGKALATERHKFLLQFKEQFLREWMQSD